VWWKASDSSSFSFLPSLRTFCCAHSGNLLGEFFYDLLR
jgi:hypothetical protein